jgi:hypothetical protein
MRAVQVLLAALIGAGAFAALIWWFGPGPLTSERPPPAPSVAPAVPAGPPRIPAAKPLRAERPWPKQPAPAPPQPEPEPEPPEADPPSEGTRDLAIYQRKPMSTVPHRVVRAWGRSDDPSQKKLVGAHLIVEPGMPDAELTKLGRDLLDYHRDATIVAVRIFDSEEAATYDRHIDGGVLYQSHLVARVVSDPGRGLRAIFVRGKQVEP